MEYKRATFADMKQIVKLRLAFLREDHKELTTEQAKQIEESLPQYFEKHLNHDITVYLAMDGDQAVSSVFLLVIEKPANPTFISGKTGVILNVYTHPDYRRKGIAKKLMNMAMEDGKEQNLSYLDLEATSDGEPLYASIGFTKKKAPYTSMRYRYESL